MNMSGLSLVLSGALSILAILPAFGLLRAFRPRFRSSSSKCLRRWAMETRLFYRGRPRVKTDRLTSDRVRGDCVMLDPSARRLRVRSVG